MNDALDAISGGAGDQARLAYAPQEAIDYYRRALAFLREENAHEQTARMLMKLGLTHHIAFDFASARQAYEEAFILWQRPDETPRRPAADASLRTTIVSGCSTPKRARRKT